MKSGHSSHDERGEPLISVIVPLFNEELAAPLLHERLVAVLGTMAERWEILYVDDGSTDGTRDFLRGVCAPQDGIGYLRFSRNFGKEAAMCAGLRSVQGDAAVIIDADLQDPPELVPEMVVAWRAGADVVNMRRRSRAGDSWLKRTTAHLFYQTMGRLSEVQMPANVGDFRLVSRRAIDALNALPERNRFLKGLYAWVGYNQVTIDYDRSPRVDGETKWRYRALVAFALEGITGFSVAPLKLASFLGMVIASGAMLFGLQFLVRTLLFGNSTAGFPTLIVTIATLGGLQLMAIGMLGEYLGRLFMEAKQRPLFLVDEVLLPAAAVGGAREVPHLTVTPLRASR